jgi:hypothetical protein
MWHNLTQNKNDTTNKLEIGLGAVSGGRTTAHCGIIGAEADCKE